MLTAFTAYPDVNEILNLLLARTSVILGAQFVGMYLYGSLSSGDFDPRSSDIDFVVITETGLAQDLVFALENLHKELWTGDLKWAARLEGSYIPKSLIRRHDPQGPACPTVNEGVFFIDRRGSDWIIQRHVIREQGVILSGPDPKALIDPVSADEIRQAVYAVLREWWFPMLENPVWLSEHGREYHAFAVISMCRALHALRYGVIVSKPVASKWAQAEFGSRWSELIERALLSQQHGSGPGFLDETLNFIRFAREQSLAY